MSTSNPQALSALAQVVKNIPVDSVMNYFVTTAAVVWGVAERHGKKRLIRDFAGKRRKLEGADGYCGSSELTETGDTPNNLGVE